MYFIDTCPVFRWQAGVNIVWPFDELDQLLDSWPATLTFSHRLWNWPFNCSFLANKTLPLILKDEFVIHVYSGMPKSELILGHLTFDPVPEVRYSDNVWNLNILVWILDKKSVWIRFSPKTECTQIGRNCSVLGQLGLKSPKSEQFGFWTDLLKILKPECAGIRVSKVLILA